MKGGKTDILEKIKLDIFYNLDDLAHDIKYSASNLRNDDFKDLIENITMLKTSVNRAMRNAKKIIKTKNETKV